MAKVSTRRKVIEWIRIDLTQEEASELAELIQIILDPILLKSLTSGKMASERKLRLAARLYGAMMDNWSLEEH